MRRDVIQQRYRCERAARAVRIALIPTGLGRALRRHNAVFVEDMINLNIFSTNVAAPQRTESSVCLAPRSFRGADLAHAPEAVTRTQPEPFIVSMPFLRPRPANWQVVCGICPRGGGFWRKCQGFFTGRLGSG
jgi:hypothetical protein